MSEQGPEALEPNHRVEGAAAPDDDDFQVAILTGMSGAGRSTAAHALEDLGWYLVDNLPASMLPQLAQLAAAPASNVTRLAAVVDARSRGFFDAFRGALAALRGMGLRPRIIFIDANDESLVRRFESVRRPAHLLSLIHI